MLALIEKWRVTHLYLAPIMFNRLLQLPASVRERYDVSSLRFVVHAAAPCPQHIKRQMIEWWGPVIHEFYGSTEVRAVAACTTHEWLERPGTVGRRSEEHTSELQSLMRISYAVFCLKKKKTEHYATQMTDNT